MEHNQEAPVFLAEREGKPLLMLQGAVDIFSAEQLHNVALQLIERDADAVVDCEKAEQVGSAACQVLLALKDALRAQGKHLLLQSVPVAVRRQFQQAGLINVLLTEETKF